MTDQTPQTTTEPVAWRFKLPGNDEWEMCHLDPRCDTTDFDEVQPLYTTPQPLAIGLDRAGEAVIDAALRQLSMMGKGKDPSPRLREAIDNFRVLALAAPTGGRA